MELSQLLLNALNLMFIGMLFVGAFLGILVVVIPFLNKIVPDDPLPAQTPAQAISPAQPKEQEILVAVISAAVQQYRKRHSNHS